MILPRWSVWPALAVLAFFFVAAVPRRVADPNPGAAANFRSSSSGIVAGSGGPCLERLER